MESSTRSYVWRMASLRLSKHQRILYLKACRQKQSRRQSKLRPVQQQQMPMRRLSRHQKSVPGRQRQALTRLSITRPNEKALKRPRTVDNLQARHLLDIVDLYLRSLRWHQSTLLVLQCPSKLGLPRGTHLCSTTVRPHPFTKLLRPSSIHLHISISTPWPLRALQVSTKPPASLRRLLPECFRFLQA